MLTGFLLCIQPSIFSLCFNNFELRIEKVETLGLAVSKIAPVYFFPWVL